MSPLATDQLKAKALELGFTNVGVCLSSSPQHLAAYRLWVGKGFYGTMAYMARGEELRSDPRKLLASAEAIVAVTLNYNQPNPRSAGQPHIARYALGRDYHKVMRHKLKRLASWIEEAHCGAECRACVDSAPILERDFAQQAGLGWFGKNTCLIDSQRGSWFFIGLVLTSVPFKPDMPAIGGCGTCRKCIDACPTGAIVEEEGRWQVDARRCISYLTIEHRGEIQPELAEKIGDWTFGCDVCQEVCPFNEVRPSQPLRASDTNDLDLLDTRKWPALKDWSDLTWEQWDALTRGSSVRRAGFDGMARNARNNLME